MRSRHFLTLALLLSAVPFLLPRSAQASGFFLTERGVRTLGRGGAFVAGAEGAESLWINPAGLAHSGESFRMEGNQTFLRGSYQRVNDMGEGTGPTVDLKTAFLPIPMFALTKDFDLEDFDFGFGFYVPSLSLYSWPDHVGDDPAPNRYSLYSLKGSIFGNFSAGVAWHGIENLSIGASAALITGRFKASTVVSACDGFVCTDPYDPAFDVTSVITLKRFATVMVGAGLIYDIGGMVKFGASVQSPWNMKGKADVDVTLPNNPLFDKATVEGANGEVKVPFPLIGRIGLEYHSDSFRWEVAAVFEGWSRQQNITVKANKMYIRDVLQIGDYQVGTIKIQRKMSDAYSLRTGFEYFMEDSNMTFRAGMSYDTSALKDKALTPLTLDANKVVVGLGLTLHVGNVFDFDLLYGHVFMPDRKIRNSEIDQPTAIRPRLPNPPAIGNGNYTMEADFAGIGSTFRF